MTVFSWLFVPSFLARFVRALGVCLLSLAVVAGRAAASEDTAKVPPVSASGMVERAAADELASEEVAADDTRGESDDRSGDASEDEDSDEGDQQAEEALQTRDSLWLACSSYELTFLSNDKGVCRCLQVDPGPARV